MHYMMNMVMLKKSKKYRKVITSAQGPHARKLRIFKILLKWTLR